MKSLYLFISLFITCLFFSLEAWSTAPWQTESDFQRSLPWKSVDDISRPAAPGTRKQRRESFFKRLNKKAGALAGGEYFRGPKKVAALRDQREIHDEEKKGSQEMKELPWKSFESKWTDSYDPNFLWPVFGGKINSGYGVRRGQFHEGLDISGKEGSLIKAVNHGRVVFSGFINGYGRTVVVYHGSGLSSVYAHNRENLVREGQLVEKGQAIATLGRTGKTSGAHLHLEIRKDGIPENPLRYSFLRR